MSLKHLPAAARYMTVQLLGIELNPAEAAQAEVFFPINDAFTAPYVIVPERTQLTAEASDGGQPIVFETERALIAVKAQLAALLAFDVLGVFVARDDLHTGMFALVRADLLLRRLRRLGWRHKLRWMFILDRVWGGPFQEIAGIV